MALRVLVVLCWSLPEITSSSFSPVQGYSSSIAYYGESLQVCESGGVARCVASMASMTSMAAVHCFISTVATVRNVAQTWVEDRRCLTTLFDAFHAINSQLSALKLFWSPAISYLCT